MMLTTACVCWQRRQKTTNVVVLLYDPNRKMIGMEYMLYEVQEPNFFVFRKQKRESPEKVTPTSAYYILDGSIYQALNIHNVIGSRVVCMLLLAFQFFYIITFTLDLVDQIQLLCIQFNTHDFSLLVQQIMSHSFMFYIFSPLLFIHKKSLCLHQRDNMQRMALHCHSWDCLERVLRAEITSTLMSG